LQALLGAVAGVPQGATATVVFVKIPWTMHGQAILHTTHQE